jgi:hypothetical protein
MSGNEFFYKDKDGKKQDASLHEPILAAGDEEAVRTTTILVTTRIRVRLPRSARLITTRSAKANA